MPDPSKTSPESFAKLREALDATSAELEDRAAEAEAAAAASGTLPTGVQGAMLAIETIKGEIRTLATVGELNEVKLGIERLKGLMWKGALTLAGLLISVLVTVIWRLALLYMSQVSANPPVQGPVAVSRHPRSPPPENSK